MTNLFRFNTLIKQYQRKVFKVQISVKVTPEESQYLESSSQPQENSASEILVDKLRAEYEDEQRAIKELDDFLEPTIIAMKNGAVSDKTGEEIVKEAIEEAKGRVRKD